MKNGFEPKRKMRCKKREREEKLKEKELNHEDMAKTPKSVSEIEKLFFCGKRRREKREKESSAYMIFTHSYETRGRQ